MKRFSFTLVITFFASFLFASLELDFNEGFIKHYDYGAYSGTDFIESITKYTLLRTEFSVIWHLYTQDEFHPIFSYDKERISFRMFCDMGELHDSTMGYPYDETIVSEDLIMRYYFESEAYISRLVHAVGKIKIDPIGGNRYLGEFTFGLFETKKFFVDLSVGGFLEEEQEKLYHAGIKIGVMFDYLSLQLKYNPRQRSAILLKSKFNPILGAVVEFGKDPLYENDYFNGIPSVGVMYENSSWGVSIKYGISDWNQRLFAEINWVPADRMKLKVCCLYEKNYNFDGDYLLMVDRDGWEYVLSAGISLIL